MVLQYLVLISEIYVFINLKSMIFRKKAYTLQKHVYILSTCILQESGLCPKYLKMLPINYILIQGSSVYIYMNNFSPYHHSAEDAKHVLE